MKAFDDLILVNYCYSDCIPFMNIMRLPQEEAFALAADLAKSILKRRLFIDLLILRITMHYEKSKMSASIHALLN